MIATLYSKVTGETLGVIETDAADFAAALDAQCDERTAWIKGNHAGKRINPATGKANKRLVLKLKVTGNMITGLPEGAVIRLPMGAEPIVVKGGRISFAAAYADRLPIRIEAPGHDAVELVMALAPAEKGDVTIAQDRTALRAMAYDREGEQLGAVWKIVGKLLEMLPPDVLGTFDPEALAVMRRNTIEVKARFPKAPEDTETEDSDEH